MLVSCAQCTEIKIFKIFCHFSFTSIPDAYDITLGKSSQDLTEVVFAFSDILQCCEVTIHADCQQKKKERKNER